MLKDSLPSHQLPDPNGFNVAPNLEVDRILEFIDNAIPSFCNYYQSVKDSDRENRISDFLVHHFQLCKIEQSGGFLPYDFRKNPTQQHSGKETDIGVFVMTRSRKPTPIIEFEAKRFSESSNNKEYVCGDRGGIERFKRGHHSAYLSVGGMFGYVQSRTSQEWITEVNRWIVELSNRNVDSTIDWSDKSEQLIKNISLHKVEKFSSLHYRKQSNDKISLWHYILELN
jgi:hypothetical protein